MPDEAGMNFNIEGQERALREYCELRGISLDELAERAGRNLPDKLPVTPRILTEADHEAFLQGMEEWMKAWHEAFGPNSF